MIGVRSARLEDAAEACEVIRRSIRELCTPDHRDDPGTIDAWLANKTEVKVRTWIAAHISVVAVREAAVVGFGLLQRSGKLLLLYVDPGSRLLGASAAMLAALEAEARQLGVTDLVLESSATALAFYERRGYQRDGDPVPGFGITVGFPLRKRLSVISGAGGPA